MGDMEDWNEFSDRVKGIHKPGIDIVGSNMLVRKGAELKSLPPFEGDRHALYKDYLPEEVMKRPHHKGWLAIVDGRGRCRSGYKGEGENLENHIIHLVSHGVSPEYLAFLQSKAIPYLVAGEKRVDLESMLGKLKTELKIECAITTSGGRLSGALLRASFVDEINIRFHPVIIGGYDIPSLFDSPNLKLPDVLPTRLELVMAQIEAKGRMWLRYKVIHDE